MSDRTIYYILPDIGKPRFDFKRMIGTIRNRRFLSHVKNNWLRNDKPIGGVKVIYQHCELLNASGYRARVLRLGKYHGNFFGFDEELHVLYDEHLKLGEEDVVILPEYYAFDSEPFSVARRILFVQQHRHLYSLFRKFKNRNCYADLGYEAVMTCSSFLVSKILEPSLKTHLIPNYIDNSRFVPDPNAREPGRVLALPRKNPKDLAQIQNLVASEGIKIFFADNLTETELISEYQKADIFLATGYPEGFGLPPLEAMACGCVVVGYTGGGAADYMIDGETALVAEDGDTVTAAQKLISIFKDKSLKDKIRTNCVQVPGRFKMDDTKNSLLNFIRTTIEGSDY